MGADSASSGRPPTMSSRRVFFMIAIARAWQMIGAWNTRVAAMMGDLLRERSASAAVADGIEDDGVPVADPFVSLEYLAPSPPT